MNTDNDAKRKEEIMKELSDELTGMVCPLLEITNKLGSNFGWVDRGINEAQISVYFKYSIHQFVLFCDYVGDRHTKLFDGTDYSEKVYKIQWVAEPLSSGDL